MSLRRTRAPGSRRDEEASPTRAAVCREFGRPLVIEELRLDPLGPSDVRVEVAACAVYHSDIHYVGGSWGGVLPVVYHSDIHYVGGSWGGVLPAVYHSDIHYVGGSWGGVLPVVYHSDIHYVGGSWGGVLPVVYHSDIHYVGGSWGGVLPVVYGHEAAGTVAEVGADVTDVAVGDRAAISLIRWCGGCAQCRRGYEVFCEAGLGPPARRLRTADGEPVEAALRCGAFAEQATVHHSQAVRLPADLDWLAASLLGCGVITGVGAGLNTSSVDETSTVAVVGLGGVGLNAVQGAALAGAPVIIAVDTHGHKLLTARRFGAPHAVNASDDVAAAAREATGSTGVTHALVTVGSAAAVRSTLKLVAPGGELVIVGMPAAGSRLDIDPLELADTGRRIVGCKMGSAQPRRDIEQIVAWRRDGALKLEELVSGVYPLEQINDAIAEVKRGEAIRNVITMSDL